MEALEFLNIVLPHHDKTSCDDEDLQNGFWSTYGHNQEGKWQGRCRRCMALQIINKDDEVPKDTNLSDCL